MAPIDITVIGELNMDLIMDHVNNLPAIGKERIAQRMVTTLGSSSAIFASNAASLGMSIAFTGRVGDDLFGRQILEILKSRKLDTADITISKTEQTGLTFIYTFQNDRGMVTYPGAMEEQTIADIKWERVAQSRHLHMSSYYLQKGMQSGCAEMFQKAKSMGLTTSLDTNWDPDEKWGDELFEVLKHVDVFLPNDDEARLISKKQNLEDAIAFLSSFGCTVVATCGARGIIARDKYQHYHVAPVDVTRVDAVGAGDSFNAGFLSKYINGNSIEACLSFGVITASFSITRAGGTTAFQDMDRFREFAEKTNPLLTVTKV
ncbi:carbohydrate kinase family protein [Balneolales bacterium ANBcel1]|nr:carbohydrate kinase family protein [Balneolales bacterium ANBcel1]